MDGDDVVEVVDGVEEFFEFFGLVGFDGDFGVGEVLEFGGGHGEAGGDEGGADFHEVGGGGDDFDAVFGFFGVFSASVEGGHEGFFAFFGDDDDAFAGELEHDGAWVGHAAAVFVEGVADFGHGAVFVVGGDFDDDADAGGAVGFVGFFNEGRGGFVGDAGDGAFDVRLGHVREAGLFEDHGEGGVHGGVGAGAGGDGDLVADFGEEGAALGVDDGFLAFGGGPFTVSRHDEYFLD